MSAARASSAVGRAGFWAAAATATTAVASLGLAVTTPPRSGPSCRTGCITYPYTDAAVFVPRDYLWMYPALLMAVAFLVLAVHIHGAVPAVRWPLSRTGVCFVAIGTGTLVVDYGLQLTVMQPGLRSGETEGLSALSQYNPHGIFIGLENIGYATLAVALLFLGAALRAAASRPGRAAGWVFTVSGAATLVALVTFAAYYRADLAYRFEVVSLLLTWLALLSGGVLLGVAFGRAGASGTADPGRSAGEGGTEQPAEILVRDPGGGMRP